MTTEFKKIAVGEVLSGTYYLTVTGKNEGAGEIQVKDQFGNNFTMRGKDLIEKSLKSASQFDEVKKVSRTEMVEVLENVGDSVFTADFVKADGADRTIVGHLVGSEPKMGRSNVYDLKVTSGHPMRQVDHRTLNMVISKGIKYTLKK